MIPKKIHYCWLSGDDTPLDIQRCINSWKEIMPDYEIICWDKKRFNIKSVSFVNEACTVKKWAFAADYIRAYALYKEGGIYLDSDVLVLKKFDPFLNYDFFTSVEYHPSIVKNKNAEIYLNADGTSKYPFTPIDGIGIQAAIIGGIKGHPFLKDCMDYYSNNHFVLNDGKFNDKIIAPAIYSMIAEKYGFKYIDKLQHLRNDMLILPSELFASTPKLSNSNSYAIHFCAGDWRDERVENIQKKWLKKLKRKSFIRKIFGKPPLK